jgi:hypothetical protein
MPEVDDASNIEHPSSSSARTERSPRLKTKRLSGRAGMGDGGAAGASGAGGGGGGSGRVFADAWAEHHQHDFGALDDAYVFIPVHFCRHAAEHPTHHWMVIPV